MNEGDVRALPRKSDGTPHKFMIVDDSEFMVNNLKRIILSFEGEVAEVGVDGADAVVKYRKLEPKPDLVTMDLTMPKMDGLEAIKHILDINKTQKIVVVSAMGNKEMVQQAILLGAKHFIVKPFKRDDIFKVFQSLLQRNPAAAGS